MSEHVNYEKMAQEAAAAAAEAGNTLESARLRLEAARRIPRYATLMPLVGDLLSPIVEQQTRPDAPDEIAEALRLLLMLARIAGAPTLVDSVTNEAQALAGEAAEPTALVSLVGKLAEGMQSVGTRPYESSLELWRQATTHAEAAGRGELAVDLGLLRAQIELGRENHTAALRALDRVLEALADHDESWDGERYHTLLTQAVVHTARNKPLDGVAATERALELVQRSALPVETGQVVIGLVPALLHVGKHDRALELLDRAIVALMPVEGFGELEMSLRNLQMKTLTVQKDLAGAIRAGFDAVERSGEVGTVDNYVTFMVSVASLYHQGGSLLDAYNVLVTAQRGLVARGGELEYIETVDTSIAAFREDIGEARFAQLVEEHERIERA